MIDKPETTVAIMQPYYFPYLGYFHLMRAVNLFVFHDDVKFTKQSWINRNRLLRQEAPIYLTQPVANDSQQYRINQRLLCDPQKELNRTRRQIDACYRDAPEYRRVMPFLNDLLQPHDETISALNIRCLKAIAGLLEIDCEFLTASERGYAQDLKGQDRVIHICLAEAAARYVNPPGAREVGLYQPEEFTRAGIEFRYLASDSGIRYTQREGMFHPNLSIIDVLMFNNPAAMQSMLRRFTLVKE